MAYNTAYCTTVHTHDCPHYFDGMTVLLEPVYIAASKEYLRRIQIIVKLLNQHFISYFVRYFHSNWLVFLRVKQVNKSGCLF